MADLYKELFYKALRIRLVEERIIELYPSDKIQSPVHLSIGQEAVAVGLCESLLKKDLLFGTYRSHALYLAKGGDMKQMFAELYGKTTGCGGGKAGSMHLAAPEVGFMGSSAVVASTIPHAVGAALSAQILKKDYVSIAVFGDGAVEEGTYHESLNFAALKKLPIIFVCENNGLAVHSKVQDRQAFNIIDHAKTFGLPTTKIVEGYDFLKIHEVFSKIVTETRKSRLPHFVEIQTFRYKEHVGPGDDFNAGYRSSKDFDKWKAKDPLLHEKKLIQEFTSLILKEISDAVLFAEESAWPDEEHLLTDVH